MSTHYELVKVTATFYQPGDVVPYNTLADLYDSQCIWFFEDETVTEVWDVLENPDIEQGEGIFIMHAIQFTFEVVHNPGLMWGGPYESALDMEIDNLGIGDVFQLEDVLDTACKYYRGAGFEYQFHLVYVYTLTVIHDWEGYADTDTEWYSLGELNFDRLPFASQSSKYSRPKIVCLCGSTRFSEAFQKANFDETLAGHIVLTIGCDMKSDNELFASMSQVERDQVKWELDRLHREKIELADEVLVLNVGDYIGYSTHSEIRYAEELGKTVRYLEPHKESEAE